MNSSQRLPDNSRSEQFKFIPTEPIKPPSASKASNKAYIQISQLLGIQRKMQTVEKETCDPWQLDCKWTLRVREAEEVSGVRRDMKVEPKRLSSSLNC